MSEECNAVREMPTRHLNFTKFPRLKLYLRTIILDWTIISTQLGVILRCFLRYEYLTYRYSFRGESYKLNVGRDLSDAKFNQSILQIKKVNPNKPRQLPLAGHTQPVAELGFKLTLPDPSVFIFLTPWGPHKCWTKRSPLLLLPCLAFPEEFLPTSREGASGLLPHHCAIRAPFSSVLTWN